MKEFVNIKNIKRDASKLRRRILAKHLWFARFVLVAFVVLIFWGAFAGIRSMLRNTPVGEYWSMANSFLFAPKDSVKSFDGRVNLLLLGLSGDGVKNPILSDTMILVSVSTDEPENIKMISIPRDIWVPEIDDKINSAYLYGNEKQNGGGLLFSKSSVEEVVGVPIQYALALDFNGFVEVIDILGGIEVEVERSFTDERFPIAGKEDDDCGGEDEEFLCRYETISFTEGKQMMNGETALKFARSRHSTDPEEGNDLARANRQQKVLIAMKNKMLSAEVISSPQKMYEIWSKFWEITETSLTRPQMTYIARLVYNAREDVSSQTIPEDLLFNPPYSDEYKNLFVFIPKAENWDEVHNWVEGVLAGGV